MHRPIYINISIAIHIHEHLDCLYKRYVDRKCIFSSTVYIGNMVVGAHTLYMYLYVRGMINNVLYMKRSFLCPSLLYCWHTVWLYDWTYLWFRMHWVENNMIHCYLLKRCHHWLFIAMTWQIMAQGKHRHSCAVPILHNVCFSNTCITTNVSNAKIIFMIEHTVQ